jgi:hypothetical protein
MSDQSQNRPEFPWTIERIQYGVTTRFWVVNGEKPIADCESLEIAEAIVRDHNAHDELVEALLRALPYVESALDDQGYKSGAVENRVKQINAALVNAGALSEPKS